MRRRQFIQTMAGTTALSTLGCSSEIKLKSQVATFSLDVTHPMPSGGTMPMGKIGKTGITVSRFGFGAHMPKELIPYEKERERTIREAHDLGVTLFDVYDLSWGLHQYEPMGKHLAPIINDVVISIFMDTPEGKTADQEMERVLRLFKRDYIDMARMLSTNPKNPYWGRWESMFTLKEKGYLRAVGMPIHYPEDLTQVLETYPIDFVVIPYNFYHNMLWDGKSAGDMNSVAKKLREKGIGIVTMKPFGTDWFVNPLINAAKKLDKSKQISLPQAALRYIINCGLHPDTTLGGMYNLSHVYENVVAYYHPEITQEEENLLETLRTVTKVSENLWLPPYYQFLQQWTSQGTSSHADDRIVS